MSGEVSGRRWRPRFSLRTFLVLFTLLSLWLGWRVYDLRRVERTVQTLLNRGAIACGETMARLPEPRPFWLRVLLGRTRGHYPRDLVISADFESLHGLKREACNDALLAETLPMALTIRTVNVLNVRNSAVTAEGIKAAIATGRFSRIELMGDEMSLFQLAEMVLDYPNVDFDFGGQPPWGLKEAIEGVKLGREFKAELAASH